MGIMIKKTTLIVLAFLASTSFLFSQNSKTFQKMFLESQSRYNNGDYAQAYDLFLGLYKNKNSSNSFRKISGYYCGLAAFKIKKYDDANFILYSLKEEDSTWRNSQDVYYLLANVAFEKNELTKAYDYLQKINAKKVLEDAKTMFAFYTKKTNDIEELILLQKNNPQDHELAKLTAERLLPLSNSNVAYSDLITYLIQDYKLNISPTSYKTTKKSEYNVAVVFPFDLKAEEQPNKASRYMEMYSGMKLAVDSLAAQKIIINLFAYDSDKDPSLISALSNSEDFKHFDLIIGPLTSPCTKQMSVAAEKFQIPYINPLNGFDDLYGKNPYTVAYKPTYKVCAQEIAKYAIKNRKNDTLAILYGTSTQDSILAFTYKKIAKDSGLYVYSFAKIDDKSVSLIKSKLPVDSKAHLGHVFIAGDSYLLTSTTMGVLEQNDLKIPIYVSNSWFDNKILSLEQFKRRSIHVYNTSFVKYDSISHQFGNKIEQKFMYPSQYKNNTALGYDIAYNFGKILNEYGTGFLNFKKEIGFREGIYSGGFKLNDNNINTVVPILRFNDEFELEWVNKPLK